MQEKKGRGNRSAPKLEKRKCAFLSEEVTNSFPHWGGRHADSCEGGGRMWFDLRSRKAFMIAISACGGKKLLPSSTNRRGERKRRCSDIRLLSGEGGVSK